MVKGITLAPAVTGCVLLDATAYLIKGITGECDDVKGVEHAGCVLKLVIDGVLISLEGIQRRDSHPRTEVFSALGQPVLVHGARPARHQVQQAGRGMFLPACQVHDAGEFTRAPAASVLVVPHASHRPWVPEPLQRRAGSSDAACRHGLIWDHTVFHMVPNWRATLKIVAPSKRNCRIAQRIARVPRRARGAHTFSLCSRNVTVWQVCSRHIQRRVMPPDPHRDPGPRRVDHLHHHTPVPLCDHPTTWAASTAITGLSVERQRTLTPSGSNQMEALHVNEQITPITTTKQHRTPGRVRHRPRS